MSLIANQNTVSETYSRLKSAAKASFDCSERAIIRIDMGGVYYNYLTSDVIPTLKSILGQMPDSVNFPAPWVVLLANYAASQTLTPSADFKADYDALRNSIVTAIAEAVNSLPVNADNKIAIQSFTADGTETIYQAPDLSALKVKLELIKLAAD